MQEAFIRGFEKAAGFREGVKTLLPKSVNKHRNYIASLYESTPKATPKVPPSTPGVIPKQAAPMSQTAIEQAKKVRRTDLSLNAPPV